MRNSSDSNDFFADWHTGCGTETRLYLRLVFPGLRVDPPSVLRSVASGWMDICGEDLAVRLLTPGIEPLILATQDGFDTDRGVVRLTAFASADH